MLRQFEIRIFGRVLGVGFRAAARKQARFLGLKGWIKNLPDGSVRAMISGESEHCVKFINWSREGSGYSWVERVDIHEKIVEQLDPFRILY